MRISFKNKDSKTKERLFGRLFVKGTMDEGTGGKEGKMADTNTKLKQRGICKKTLGLFPVNVF
jgi:hypothetical protein